MGAMASQITSLTIISLTVYSGADLRKHHAGNSPVTGEFPAHRDSDAENVSISWHHHETILSPNSEVSVCNVDVSYYGI